MSDARWFEIDSAVAAAVRHFGGAVSIYGRLAAERDAYDRYMVEMAFMHAMQAGHTFLEMGVVAYPRIMPRSRAGGFELACRPHPAGCPCR